ncbi:MAG: hypothetical protein CM1200mP30_21820 [Pseudomonadota bacterium]|nr:MAG: hypothetical protein CM1200mP30_21820 [Pseudomonadota bacterium]
MQYNELKEKLKDLVGNLVGRKVFKKFYRRKKYKGVLFLRSENGEFRWYKEGDEDKDGKYEKGQIFKRNPY